MTKRQEHFARLVAGGSMSQADAYRTAYPASRKWKPEAVRREASVLLRNPNVSQTVAALQRKAEDGECMECRELRHRLTRRIRALDESGEGSAADFCKYADSLARISGWNQPDAVAVAAVQIVTPEERARKIREALGIPEEVEG